MTEYHVEHLGCKVSHTDAEVIAEALAQAGHARARDTAAADVHVINACCLTVAAEKKVRQRVRRAVERLSDPSGVVFVTGCGAANEPRQYTDIDARVVVVPGAAGLAAATVVEAADGLAGLGCRGPAAGTAPGHDAGSAPASSPRTRAFLKVQDGCDFDCSYCIVPAVRGAPRSRSTDAILAETARRVAQGRRELVLTGVNIGLYRDPDSRIGLDRLLLAVADVPGVHRVRISSIESNHVNRRLLAAMAEHPLVCPHLHVPLQSGDDAVLRNMGRHYDSARYERALTVAREAVPDLNVTTDVIVGYPGEDDDAFERTLQLANRIGFTKVHAFPFSARPGTDAAQRGDAIARSIKDERSRALRAQADAHALRHRSALVGTTDEVVVETRGVIGAGAAAGVILSEHHVASDVGSEAAREAGGLGRRTGYTRDYSPVHLVDVGDAVVDGDLVRVRLAALDAASGVLTAHALG